MAAKKYREGDKYGAHRVIKPKGVLPQAADVIDNDMEIYDNEILVDVRKKPRLARVVDTPFLKLLGGK